MSTKKQPLLIGLILACVFSWSTRSVAAATPIATQAPSQIEISTDSAFATASAEIVATASTKPIEAPPVIKSEKDITETTTQTQDTLVKFLNEHPVEEFRLYNPLQWGIRKAISNGVSPNILVLILLFPVITSIIAFSRHIIGLKGFGIYTPAVLSVAFLSTGILNGISIFIVTLVASTLMKRILGKLQLQYLPRTAMLLWGVSIFMLLAFVLLSFIPASSLSTIRIFPLLIIMLLTENFMESQLTGSQAEAQQLTTETLIIATVCSVLIGWEPVQQFVILQPELTLLAVAAANMIVGRYTGLRLLEWLRFRTIISK